MPPGLAPTQYHHPQRDHEEREQRAGVRDIGQGSDGEQGCEKGYSGAGYEGDHMRGVKTFVHVGKNCGHQSVARHGKQDPGLTINHHEHYRREGNNRGGGYPVANRWVSHLAQHKRQGLLGQG